MPKYFDGEKPLPFSRVAITSDRFSEKWLQQELTRKHGKMSLCLRFAGFPNDSLGYVFNIERAGDDFRISDITGKQLLTVANLGELVAMVLHVSGTRYNADWQTEFQKMRNQITSKTGPI
jgi:hypothetical protein